MREALLAMCTQMEDTIGQIKDDLDAVEAGEVGRVRGAQEKLARLYGKFEGMQTMIRHEPEQVKVALRTMAVPSS